MAYLLLVFGASLMHVIEEGGVQTVVGQVLGLGAESHSNRVPHAHVPDEVHCEH
jgi:hypothetical protein